MCLLQMLVGAATPEALGFWLADKGKVTQRKGREGEKERKCQTGKERERINGLS